MNILMRYLKFLFESLRVQAGKTVIDRGHCTCPPVGVLSCSTSKNKENQPLKTKAKRPEKLRGWTNESMLQAMDALKAGEMGVNRAALEHGLP